jgi:cytochrome c peroxidase
MIYKILIFNDMKKIFFGFIILLLVIACGDDAPTPFDSNRLTDITYQPIPYKMPNLDSALGFLSMPIPTDNPLTVEGVELGRRLFYDPILSGDSTQACASCHKQNLAFTDGNAVSKGVTGQFGRRSSMSLENIGFMNKGLFWDGRTNSLETQALLPVEDPIELHHNWTNLETKLRQHADYPTRFRKAFGIQNKSEINKLLAAKAIAQFERTLISGNAKVDKIRRHEAGFEFTVDELAGFELFFNVGLAADAQCGHCHSGTLYTNHLYENNGLDSALTLNDFRDKGLGGFNQNPNDNGKFRTPSLRNIELTAPYMHDGRFNTLEEVVTHYASGGHYSETRNPFLPQIRDLQLTARKQRQLIAFMKTLTDTSFTTNPNFKNPFK